MNSCLYCSLPTKGKVCMSKLCQNKKKQQHYHDNLDHYRLLKKEERKRNFGNRKDKQLAKAKLRYYSNDLKDVTAIMLQNVRARSKQYKMEFDLDQEFLLKLFEKQNNKCAVSNIYFKYDVEIQSRNKRPFAPSLDRIDCDKGYTQNNVRLVCIIVNIAISDFGDLAFHTMRNNYVNNLEIKE